MSPTVAYWRSLLAEPREVKCYKCVMEDAQGSLEEIDRRLKSSYGVPSLGNKEDPLDELIFIILSGVTRENVYLKTFEMLRSRFSTWYELTQVDETEIERQIRAGGLAKKKARQIKQLLEAIIREVGEADLSFLETFDDASAEAFLRRLPGVGPKSARCVLAYSLKRPKFAVDAHVFRILRRLGWSHDAHLTEKVQDRLEEIVPPSLRYTLHVNLVVHGRTVCKPSRPRCDECILADICPSAFKVGWTQGDS